MTDPTFSAGSESKNGLMIAIGVLLIIAAGIAAWWYFSPTEEEPEPEPIKTSADVAEAVTAPRIRFRFKSG